jgi:hypothetical protein
MIITIIIIIIRIQKVSNKYEKYVDKNVEKWQGYIRTTYFGNFFPKWGEGGVW